MKKILKSWRYWMLLPIPLGVLIITAFASPDGWRAPLVQVVFLAWSLLAIVLAHGARKALFDYVNGETTYKKAMETSEGASRVFLGLCILTAVMIFSFMSFAARAAVPERAIAASVLVNQEIDHWYPTIPLRSYVGALVEQETCPSLKSPMCWSTKAKLKTSREEGAGLGQFTRTWNANGSQRFDALADVKKLNPAALKELSWDNVYARADLSIRALLIKQKDCDGRMQNLNGSMLGADRQAFCDAAYNGGYGGMQSDRKLCVLHDGCNPLVWFGNVEKYSNKSRQKWQGYGKSAFDINREHVAFTVPFDPPSRRAKYIPYFGV